MGATLLVFGWFRRVRRKKNRGDVDISEKMVIIYVGMVN